MLDGETILRLGRVAGPRCDSVQAVERVPGEGGDEDVVAVLVEEVVEVVEDERDLVGRGTLARRERLADAAVERPGLSVRRRDGLARVGLAADRVGRKVDRDLALVEGLPRLTQHRARDALVRVEGPEQAPAHVGLDRGKVRGDLARVAVELQVEQARDDAAREREGRLEVPAALDHPPLKEEGEGPDALDRGRDERVDGGEDSPAGVDPSPCQELLGGACRDDDVVLARARVGREHEPEAARDEVRREPGRLGDAVRAPERVALSEEGRRVDEAEEPVGGGEEGREGELRLCERWGDGRDGAVVLLGRDRGVERGGCRQVVERERRSFLDVDAAQLLPKARGARVSSRKDKRERARVEREGQSGCVEGRDSR